MNGESAKDDSKATMKDKGSKDEGIASDTRTQTPTDSDNGQKEHKKSDSSSSSSSNYLQNALGDVLADALSHVAKKRPVDPIEYVANYLYSVSEGNSSKNQSSSSNNNDPDEDGKLFNRRRRSGRGGGGTIKSSRYSDEVKGNGSGAANYQDAPQMPSQPSRLKRVEDHHYPSENSSGGGDTDEHVIYRERNTKASSWRRRRTATTNQSDGNDSIGLSTASTTSSFANSGSQKGFNRRFRSLSLSRQDDITKGSSKRRNNFSRYANQSDDSAVSSNNTRGGRSTSRSRKSTTKFSKHLPTVAMTPDEYKVKRGMRLPPMEAKTSSSSRRYSRGMSASDPSLNRVRAARKPKQLDPLEPNAISTFDIDRHRRRTQKLIEQRLR